MADFINVSHISVPELIKIAYECGFMKRQSKKINAASFLADLCFTSIAGSPSFNDLAAHHHAQYNICASKQAFWKRVNTPCVIFLQMVLAYIIKKKCDKEDIRTLIKAGSYKRVIIQDSTIIKLPIRLFDIFSGVSNSHTAVCNARIQGVYELLTGRFLSFSIDPYSKNDLTAAPELKLKKGDLVLRDRGYSCNDEIRRHTTSGADCIFRHKFKSIYTDLCNGKNIHLISLLKKLKNLDMQVCLTDNEKTKVRLIAIPVSPEIANLRRMKAKKEMRGHNPPNDLLFLMSWTIFITTIHPSTADANKILQIYRIRWRIENLFKMFKSHMNFSKIHNVSLKQLYILITARLIMIVSYVHLIYMPCYSLILAKYGRHLSLLKFCNYLMNNINKLIDLLNHWQDIKHYIVPEIYSIIRYCTYDKRKRLNFNLFVEKTLLS
jgi:Transposase DDE domain